MIVGLRCGCGGAAVGLRWGCGGAAVGHEEWCWSVYGTRQS